MYRPQEGSFRVQELEYRQQEETSRANDQVSRVQSGRAQEEYKVQGGVDRPPKRVYRPQEGSFRVQELEFREQEESSSVLKQTFRELEGSFRVQEEARISGEVTRPTKPVYRPKEGSDQVQGSRTEAEILRVQDQDSRYPGFIRPPKRVYRPQGESLRVEEAFETSRTKDQAVREQGGSSEAKNQDHSVQRGRFRDRDEESKEQDGSFKAQDQDQSARGGVLRPPKRQFLPQQGDLRVEDQDRRAQGRFRVQDQDSAERARLSPPKQESRGRLRDQNQASRVQESVNAEDRDRNAQGGVTRPQKQEYRAQGIFGARESRVKEEGFRPKDREYSTPQGEAIRAKNQDHGTHGGLARPKKRIYSGQNADLRPDYNPQQLRISQEEDIVSNLEPRIQEVDTRFQNQNSKVEPSIIPALNQGRQDLQPDGEDGQDDLLADFVDQLFPEYVSAAPDFQVQRVVAML